MRAKKANRLFGRLLVGIGTAALCIAWCANRDTLRLLDTGRVCGSTEWIGFDGWAVGTCGDLLLSVDYESGLVIARELDGAGRAIVGASLGPRETVALVLGKDEEFGLAFVDRSLSSAIEVEWAGEVLALASVGDEFDVVGAQQILQFSARGEAIERRQPLRGKSTATLSQTYLSEGQWHQVWFKQGPLVRKVWSVSESGRYDLDTDLHDVREVDEDELKMPSDGMLYRLGAVFNHLDSGKSESTLCHRRFYDTGNGLMFLDRCLANPPTIHDSANRQVYLSADLRSARVVESGGGVRRVELRVDEATAKLLEKR